MSRQDVIKPAFRIEDLAKIAFATQSDLIVKYQAEIGAIMRRDIPKQFRARAMNNRLLPADQDALERYNSGETIEEIAAADGIKEQTVRSRLVRAGAIDKRQGYRRSLEQEAEHQRLMRHVHALRKQGMQYRVIADEIGSNRNALRMRYRRWLDART